MSEIVKTCGNCLYKFIMSCSKEQLCEAYKPDFNTIKSENADLKAEIKLYKESLEKYQLWHGDMESENAELKRVAEKLCEFILSYTDCQRCPLCDYSFCNREYLSNQDCIKAIIAYYRKELQS